MDSIWILLLNRYFWLICLFVTWLNAVIFKVRSRPYIRENPALAPGYATLIRGFLVCSSLPWLVMGFGILVGDVPAIWYFLYPNTNNPYVLVWWVMHWLNIGSIAYWVILRGGAEMMLSHPGVLRGRFLSPKMVKFFWLLMLGTVVATTIIMFNQPLPTRLVSSYPAFYTA